MQLSADTFLRQRRKRGLGEFLTQELWKEASMTTFAQRRILQTPFKLSTHPFPVYSSFLVPSGYSIDFSTLAFESPCFPRSDLSRNAHDRQAFQLMEQEQHLLCYCDLWEGQTLKSPVQTLQQKSDYLPPVRDFVKKSWHSPIYSPPLRIINIITSLLYGTVFNMLQVAWLRAANHFK